MRNLCFFGLHKWGLWEQYVWSGVFVRVEFPTGEIATSERRQKRNCELCGKEQDELVRKG